MPINIELETPNHVMSQTKDLFTDQRAALKKLKTSRPPVKVKLKTVLNSDEASYTAADIEILEGLEPVRRRPSMYIGGTDEKAMHHLFAEVLDNSMDEAVAGHAGRIEVKLTADGYLEVTDNGRGIPIDPHPKLPDKSALEVIMTTLHAGGKFSGKTYQTSGGLHGVGISVVNALSIDLQIEIARERQLYRQGYKQGHPTGPLQSMGPVANRRGTTIRFTPDPAIFGQHAKFRPQRLFQMARSKAYLFGGVEIRWHCTPELLDETSEIPAEATLHFPQGLRDFLSETIAGRPQITSDMFSGSVKKPDGHGSIDWAITWFAGADGFLSSYCNTIPTPDGGTHEAGLRTVLVRGLKTHGELIGNKRVQMITAEDVMTSSGAILSVFISEPEFQGQTKERLANAEAARLVDNAIRDHFDHWLAESPSQAARLIDWVVDRAEERIRRRRERDIGRKNAMRKLRLPGKLSDCSKTASEGTEIFIVEGDSAGGSAKQARERATQAILPLRGKILNVASATSQKMLQNQQLTDLSQALGCSTGSAYQDEDLRYERVIIMTDADVDGAHIASLLITFFYQEMRPLIENGHLYLAVPPLYRISQGGKTLYARDDLHRAALIESDFSGRGKVEISRFKGLGEMMPAQLKETTMSRETRTLLKVTVSPESTPATTQLVNELMGTKPEARFTFIQEHAEFAQEIDI